MTFGAGVDHWSPLTGRSQLTDKWHISLKADQPNFREEPKTKFVAEAERRRSGEKKTATTAATVSVATVT